MEINKSWMWTRYVLKGSKRSMGQTMPLHVAKVRTDVTEQDSQHVAAASTDSTEQVPACCF